MVFVDDPDQETVIHCENLEPVFPSLNDHVKVMYGDLRDVIGTLINIDGQEGIVNIENASNIQGGNIQMIQLRFLCKYQS